MALKQIGSKFFEDTQLESELHNRLSSQLRNQETARKLLRLAGWKDSAWAHTVRDVCERVLTDYERTALDAQVSAKVFHLETHADDFLKVDIQSQMPVLGYSNNWLIGYVDIVYQVYMIRETGVELGNVMLRKDITFENKSWPRSPIRPDGTKAIYIMVETHTRYVDQILREINTLKQYLPGIVGFVIYSPDTSARDDLIGMNVKLISPADIGLELNVNN
jgi:hypothetical protein